MTAAGLLTIYCVLVLLASLAGEDVSFAKLGDLIEKDTVVAGNILHLVNSALYARRATITSVRHALALLGMDKVRNTLLGMSISRMWSQVKTPPVWSMARFNRHSAAVAILSDQIASRIPAAVYPEGAFVGGLLHDLGRLLIALGLPDEFTRLVKLHEQSERSWTECERELLGFTHADLSAEALGKWEFPEEVRIAVRDHHNPPAFQPGGAVPLGAVIDAANQYVNSTGESSGRFNARSRSSRARLRSFRAPMSCARAPASCDCARVTSSATPTPAAS